MFFYCPRRRTFVAIHPDTPEDQALIEKCPTPHDPFRDLSVREIERLRLLIQDGTPVDPAKHNLL